MKRPVGWSREALDDVQDQLIYIAADNPNAARRIADRIRDAAESLGEMAIGRRGRVSGTYEKVVKGLPYIIAYAIVIGVTGEEISILRIIHAARDWPNDEWPE